MQSNRRFDRFDPVTIRAAARVVRIGTRGHLAQCEVAAYLQELAHMASTGQPGAHRSLWRLARRRSELGRNGVYGVLPSRRGALGRPRTMARPLAAACRGPY